MDGVLFLFVVTWLVQGHINSKKTRAIAQLQQEIRHLRAQLSPPPPR
jgi:hypothetical protein